MLISPDKLSWRFHRQVEDMVTSDVYANEPSRNPALRVLTQTPFNAETPLAAVEQYDVTPTELHFKRHHLPVPQMEVSTLPKASLSPSSLVLDMLSPRDTRLLAVASLMPFPTSAWPASNDNIRYHTAMLSDRSLHVHCIALFDHV